MFCSGIFEECAEVDFVDNHDLCIIGTNKGNTFDIVRKAHGQLPKQTIKLTQQGLSWQNILIMFTILP